MIKPALPPENQYGHTKKLRFLLEEIEQHRAALQRPVRLLDFGCGNGSAVSQYLMGDGVEYYGVDIHPESLEHARSNYGGPAAHFRGAIPPGILFDVIIYADVLEHVQDPAALLREHAALLSPGGIVLAAVPNGYGPFEIESRLDRWFRLSDLMAWASRTKRRLLGQPIPQSTVSLPYNHESGHLVFFTQRSLRSVVAGAGYHVIRFAHGAFIGASISGVILDRSMRLKSWNTDIADHLPAWAVSTWYMTLKRSS